MARFGSFAIAILVLCITSTSVQGQAKTLLEQRKEMDRIKETVVEASKKYKSGEFEEAGKLISAAIADANKILTEADPRAKKFFEPTLKNIEKAHQLLSIEGVELPELPGRKPKIARRELERRRRQFRQRHRSLDGNAMWTMPYPSQTGTLQHGELFRVDEGERGWSRSVCKGRQRESIGRSD